MLLFCVGVDSSVDATLDHAQWGAYGRRGAERRGGLFATLMHALTDMDALTHWHRRLHMLLRRRRTLPRGPRCLVIQPVKPLVMSRV
jgi:hypothetical protein